MIQCIHEKKGYDQIHRSGSVITPFERGPALVFFSFRSENHFSSFLEYFPSSLPGVTTE